MNTSPCVLIVGAGPVGLTAAAFLTHYGISCRIIDKKAAATQTSNAVGVHARTLELLAELGLTETFLASSRQVEDIEFFIHQNQLLRLNFRLVESPYHFVADTPQYATEQLLIDYLQKHQVTIDWNTTLLKVTQSSDKVTVEIDSQGQKQTQSVDWLIACDGFHSTVRDAAKIRYEGSEFQYKFIMIDAPIVTSQSLDIIYAAKIPGLSLFIFPMQHSARIIAEIGSNAEFKDSPPTPEIFQKMVDRCFPFKMTIQPALWQSHFYVHDRLAAQYRAGRIFIAGDAAHAHIPAAAQGMNTGMQDTMNLAWKLALVIQGKASETLLDSYETERRPVAQAVLNMTTKMGKGFFIRNKWLAAIVTRLIAFIGSQKPIQKKLVNTIAQLKIHYPKSTLVVGHRYKQLIPGQRYPFMLNAPLNGKFLVLDFQGDLTLETSIATVTIVKNPAEFGGINAGYCIIRPDRYIGYVGQNKAEVYAYFQDL